LRWINHKPRGDQVFMLDGWETCLYMILPCVCECVRAWLGICSVYVTQPLRMKGLQYVRWKKVPYKIKDQFIPIWLHSTNSEPLTLLWAHIISKQPFTLCNTFNCLSPSKVLSLPRHPKPSTRLIYNKIYHPTWVISQQYTYMIW